MMRNSSVILHFGDGEMQICDMFFFFFLYYVKCVWYLKKKYSLSSFLFLRTITVPLDPKNSWGHLLSQLGTLKVSDIREIRDAQLFLWLISDRFTVNYLMRTGSLVE